MNNQSKIIELSNNLASHLQKQRDIFLSAFNKNLNSYEPIRNKYKLSIEKAIPITSAFQIVHVMSFIQLNKYLNEEFIGIFINNLIDSFFGNRTDNLMDYINQYTNLKKMKIAEQSCRFCEDVTMAILNSPSGMLYGPGFSSMGIIFLYKNWGIVAYIFGDIKKYEECKKSIKSLKNRRDT